MTTNFDLTIDVSDLAKAAAQNLRKAFIRLDSAEDETPLEGLPTRESDRVLSVVLAQMGDDYENLVCSHLADLDDTLIVHAADWPDAPWDNYDAVVDQLAVALDRAAGRAPGDGPVVLFQLPLRGDLGVFDAYGHADVFLLWPAAGTAIDVQTADVKASWTTETGAELQSTGYSLLFEQVIDRYDLAVTINSLEAGVINRETGFDTIATRDDVPTFNRDLREGDIEHLLGEDGPFWEAYMAEEFGTLPFVGGQTAPYAELYNLIGCQTRDIGLLDLSATEQEKLRTAGFERLDDLAAAIEPPPDDRPRVFDDDPAITDPQLRELAEQHEWRERLTITAQRAQSLLAALHPDHPYAQDHYDLHALQGTGPLDIPSEQSRFTPACEDDAPLIRVYLNVQRSYINDRLLMVSGRICSTDSPIARSFATLVDDYYELDNDRRNARLERDLLCEALEDELFQKIRAVAVLANDEYAGDDAYLHFYTYSGEEVDALIDACDRHPMVAAARETKALLVQQQGGDQQLVSCLKPIVQNHFARPFGPNGLVPIHDILTPTPTSDDEGEDEAESEARDEDEDDSPETVAEFCAENGPPAPHAPSVDWRYTPEGSDMEVNLFTNFTTQLFGYKTEYIVTDDGIEFVGEDDDHDWKLPTAPRSESNIPIENMLDALGFFDRDWTDTQMREKQIKAYQTVELPDGTERDATREDIEALGREFAGALHDVERMLWARDHNMPKEPLDMRTLGPDTPAIDADDDRPPMAAALEDYLTIDHAARTRDLQSHYQKPPRERILTNQSLPIEIDNVDADGDSHLVVEGHTVLDAFVDNPDEVASATRVSGPEDGSTGSWMVANPLQETADGSYVEHAEAPNDLNTGTNLTVSHYDSETGRIVLEWFASGDGSDDHSFQTWNTIPVADPDDLDADHGGTWFDRYQWLLAPDHHDAPDVWMLDPAGDDRVARKCLDALDHLDVNPGFRLIQRLRNGDPVPSTPDRDDALDEFLEWTRSDDCDYLPSDADDNDEQAAYITCDYCRVSLLQGPPGTGKTKGAHARGVVGRLHATEMDADRDTPFRGLLTGSSGTAVTTFLHDTADLTTTYTASDRMPCDADDIELVKLVLNMPPADDRRDDITYVDYNSAAGRDRLETLLTGGDRPLEDQPHVIIAATPGRVHKTARNLFAEPYEHPPGLFDVIAADEASMLQLPHLLLVTAFMHADDASQLLIAGDHRQMPPVQHHDWEEERQENILRHLPFLSVLNYFRHLRGEDVRRVPDEAPVRPPVADEVDTVATATPADDLPHVDLPMERLVVSYRCHELLTDLVAPHHYQQDNIAYTSNTTETMTPTEAWRDAVRNDEGFDFGVDAAMGDDPFIVIPHEEATSAQSNPAEAGLSAGITNRLPDDVDWGCVTPHNSQKGLLRTRCGAVEDIDTVESFQGGERDAVVLSATVSDPDYQQAEQEFILEPNRVNVALTRMKHKVVVLVPKSLLHILPREADDYENARLWKAIREVTRNTAADWEGSLAEFAPETPADSDIDVAVYAVSDLPDAVTKGSSSNPRVGIGR